MLANILCRNDNLNHQHMSNITLYSDVLSLHTLPRFWIPFSRFTECLDEGIRTSISQIATCGKNPAQVLGFNV